jgi:uncharacterized SAM-binding protein YcdF (DUF218 family)
MTATTRPILTNRHYGDALTLWNYHQLGHKLRPTSVGVVLGCHDIGVATYAARLHADSRFPLIVFTGANAPSTIEAFPGGEAAAFHAHALSLGVPPEACLVEPEARHTGDNITLSRELLDRLGIAVDSVTLVSRPSQQRRAYATCRRLWPQVEVICAPHPTDLAGYLQGGRDAHHVVSMLVGDTQRIVVYAQMGRAIPQPMPAMVVDAYWRLVDAGYTRRVIPDVALSPEQRPRTL